VAVTGWKELTAVPRPTSSLAAFWVLTGFCTLLVGDAAVQGDWRLFGLAVAPAALVVWLGWQVLYRPEVRFDSRRVVIVNPGRTSEIPWRHVSEVQQRLQIVVELDDGRKVTAWGSPFPEKPGLRRPVPGERRRSVPGAELLGAYDASRNPAPNGAPDSPVSRRWDVVLLLLGAVLAVACAVELLVAL
jgi:hypothetical protein